MSNQVPWHDDDKFWQCWRTWDLTDRFWEDAPGEVDRVIELAGLEPGADLLDLGCGPGRHSLEFAARGFIVTGVDRCAAYVDEAKQRAQERALEVEFVAADMRMFCRPAAFDAAVNLFMAFGYFEPEEENRQVLANLFDSLRPGGTLVMELMGKETLARIFTPRDWSETDGVLHLRETRTSKNWSWIENQWIYIDGTDRQEFHVSHWVYSARELEAMLHEAGFGQVDVYGSLDGVPYDHEAQRLAMVARK